MPPPGRARQTPAAKIATNAHKIVFVFISQLSFLLLFTLI